MNPANLRIHVRGARPSESERVEIADGEHVLIGRSPDWSRVDSSRDLTRARCLALPVPSVSADHVRVHREGDLIHIADVGSRNGTWVAVPSGAEVTARTRDELSIHLAPTSADDADSDEPSDVSFSGRSDYARAIAGALESWLATKELPSRISIVSANAELSDEVGRIPLASSEDLVIEPTRTVGPGWLTALAQAERWVRRQNVLFDAEDSMRVEGLIVASPAMRRAVARVVDAAAAGARVLLITGPSGVGKDGLANLFHRRLGRAGPFVARNCAMFSKELVRSELFGAEKGAFTGSVQRIVGAVEMANEGTLFLDELGELPRDVQPMLLRFLDHGEYERLGSYGRARADVRIVAATNRDLRKASLENEFRTDLWFRLSVHVVEVPPLAERPEDVVAYLRSREIAKGQPFVDALAPGVIDLLTQHAWAGNFRELVNFVERCISRKTRGALTLETAAEILREGALQPAVGASPPRSPVATDEWTAWALRAREAFAEDHDGAFPQTWDHIKDLVENYLKPILFAELSAASGSKGIDDVDLRVAAERVRADRGTAAKQLRRFFDRFGP
ncbi:MAG: sigma 54-interacting transcriptional regulator [Labilithrix sp.]|nr:sigma 54-interacting transcriptional regulator [Labilithrix sp.]